MKPRSAREYQGTLRRAYHDWGTELEFDTAIVRAIQELQDNTEVNVGADVVRSQAI